MGVWIEIQIAGNLAVAFAVTPLVGVWIEIVWAEGMPNPYASLPLWECGLKYI